MEEFVKVMILALVFGCVCVTTVTSAKRKELVIDVIHKPEECSETAEPGDKVAIHYTGTLESGGTFDSSRSPGREPLDFELGKGHVIPGWEQGLQGMCVGEKRKLIIPPHLAYGKQGHPPQIPGSATLLFEVEMMVLTKKTVERDFLKLAQFLAIPVFVVYCIYYLYNKMSQESNKPLKEEKRGKKKRK